MSENLHLFLCKCIHSSTEFGIPSLQTAPSSLVWIILTLLERAESDMEILYSLSSLTTANFMCLYVGFILLVLYTVFLIARQ